jgi:hypothetical protein
MSLPETKLYQSIIEELSRQEPLLVSSSYLYATWSTEWIYQYAGVGGQCSQSSAMGTYISSGSNSGAFL